MPHFVVMLRIGLQLRVGAVVLGVLLLTPHLSGQGAVNHDPDTARFVTSDIPRFWHAWDDAITAADPGDVFEREYIEGGSAGLKDFNALHIQGGRPFASAAMAHRQYLQAVRANTLALDATPDLKDRVRAAFRKLKEAYPPAAFPDVYFVMGRFSSGGDTSPHGLLIGVEMNARDERTPVNELTAWERAVIGKMSDLPYIVAHESVHFQQKPSPASPTLLETAIREGGADFVGELMSGDLTNRVQRTYGDAHESALWAEFSTQRSGRDLTQWFYQGDAAKDRPADLGYYVGYRICRALYERTPNKADAIRLILQSEDAEALLRASQYAGHL